MFKKVALFLKKVKKEDPGNYLTSQPHLCAW